MFRKRWAVVLVAVCLLVPGIIYAQDFPGDEAPLIAPPSVTLEIKEAKIDQEFFEVSPFFGLYAVEGFSTSMVYGLNLAFHLTEDVYFEANYGMSSVSADAFTVKTGVTIFTDTDLSYWNVNLGYNLSPGQIFLTRNRTLNSTLYLVGGVGQTDFDARNRFTFNIGTGYKIFFTDWMDAGFRLSVHSFEADLTGAKERMYNLEGIVAVGFFF